MERILVAILLLGYGMGIAGGNASYKIQRNQLITLIFAILVFISAMLLSSNGQASLHAALNVFALGIVCWNAYSLHKRARDLTSLILLYFTVITMSVSVIHFLIV